jgi:hypothetical protein
MARKFRVTCIKNKSHLIAILLIVSSAVPSISAEWSIGIYSGNTPYNLSYPENVINPVLTARDVTDIPATFVADPFMVFENNTWYMFFEVYVSQTGLGHIGVATSSIGLNWVYNQIVLKENFHTAYPYVFKWQNDYYMIPDTFSINSIRLYKATNFPYQWEFVTSLLNGPGYLDPSVVYYNNRWWLFTSVPSNDKLYLFYADNLLGPWTSHIMNPIISGNSNTARPGGRIVNYNGTFLRHAQDDNPTYGNAVHVFEITNLTTTSYSEREMPGSPFLKASGIGWNSKGMHNVDPIQITNDNWIACVDGYGDPFDTQPSISLFVWLEAESGSLTAPMAIGSDSQASSGAYLWIPEGSGDVLNNPSQAVGSVAYTFSVSVAGNYVVWGRLIDNLGNSFFVSMDSGSYALWDTVGGSTWGWDWVNNRGVADPMVYSLGVGQHTLVIKHREDGAKLDRILITNDMAYVPQGQGNAVPSISLSPASLSASTSQGSNTSNQSFQVRNSGGGTLSYTISDSATWLSCTPTSGTSTGEQDPIAVNYATSGLSAGTYSATITVTASGATNSPQTIPVSLTAAAGAVAAAESGGGGCAMAAGSRGSIGGLAGAYGFLLLSALGIAFRGWMKGRKK